MQLSKNDPQILKLIKAEEERQEFELELIASENYTSLSVMEALGTALTNKYSEGYIGKRYYAGNQVIDEIEELAIHRAKKLFSAECVNVQPLSGSPANAAVYFATLKPGDKVMGLKLDHGGHLSHGHPVNFSGMMYDFSQYGVDEKTGLLDMNQVRDKALKHRPKMLIAGFSAYSRNIDWAAFKSIADEIGAITFADIAHIAGLIAGKAIENPVPLFDIVTTTTHKTLRGPRGAIIMCKEPFEKAINRSVFPGLQGGPHDHMTAAKAVCFGEALKSEFQEYAKQVIENAQMLSDCLIVKGFDILTGGTDNHLLVVDLRSKNCTGKDAEFALESIGISCSRSTIPGDTQKAMNPSGIRLGTAAITTRGFKKQDMEVIAEQINLAIQNKEKANVLIEIKQKIKSLCEQYPLYR